MRVDFYLLSHGTVEAALPRIAKSVKGAGERLLVVSGDADQLALLDKALWEQLPEDFLAHGVAGQPHAARQPLLLGESCAAGNQARFVAFADGVWRDEAFGFERAFLFFDSRTIDAARGTWRMLGEREEIERRFWKQEGGRWVEGP
ncbi:MAG TPA: DNA polymerase III subunit chi [Croceibacterium sp.]